MHVLFSLKANKQNQTAGKASDLEMYQGAANETYTEQELSRV